MNFVIWYLVLPGLVGFLVGKISQTLQNQWIFFAFVVLLLVGIVLHYRQGKQEIQERDLRDTLWRRTGLLPKKTPGMVEDYKRTIAFTVMLFASVLGFFLTR